MGGKIYILRKDTPFLISLVDDGNPITGQYKIGKTKRDVGGRRAGSGTGSSYPVVVHAEYSVRNHHRAEKILHEIFSSKQIQKGSKNEWYHLAPWDLWIIDVIVRFL